MALPFVYKKKPRATMDHRFDDDPILTIGPTGEPETPEQVDERHRIEALSNPYPTVNPAYVPPAEDYVDPAPVAPAVTPAVDPALLTRTRTVAEPPVVSRSGQVMNADATRARRVETDKRGRPVMNTTFPTREEGLKDLQARVNKYEPTKATGWRKWLPILLGIGSTAAAVATKDPDTAARAMAATARNVFNPRAADEDWKRAEQAKIGKEVDRGLSQRHKEATIANIEAQPGLKRAAQEQRQQGIDLQGRRVSDQRVIAALKDYNSRDYTPGANPSLDEWYASAGLHKLPPRKTAEKFELRLINGELLRVPKSGGQATAVLKDDNPVVDESKVTDKSVTIGDQTFDNLTSKEAATLQRAITEGSKNRASRERIASQGQAGQDRRKAMGSGSGPLNGTIKGAASALGKFRALTAQIAKYKNETPLNGSLGDDDPVVKALYSQRDGLESDIKRMYGDYIELDEKGKPSGLKENPSRLNIQGAIERFKVLRKREPTKEEVARMQAAIDSTP